ncbi:beta-1,3-N-acetylglucosaminyltransferase lunatic fringe-like [Periophthalmus magnuspinnatus]|uniref:beta-1,3-N-acetylglucosaminyltransferase lunatic fringe-like n=1 Tax=Periophthalmus magnuspinnatus TaxID=409849 RepID=UPI002437260B|nr:beta-1,3-N-acetylglucosaminyltransferase lunatic fringe-like [Periophthalmus magnuspinnatus]
MSTNMTRKPRTSASTPAAAFLLVTGMLVLSCGHRSSSLPLEEEPAPTATLSAAGKVFSLYFQRLTRERRTTTTTTAAGARSSSASPRVVEQLSPADLFIAVKSTARFHRSRLELLLETWMSRSMAQTFVFTDAEDPQLQPRLGDHLIHTHCSSAHTRQALSCKMFYEYDTFLRSGRKWLCHVDDDNYVNVVALLKLLSQYHHTEDVYLGRPSTGTPLQASYSTQGAAPQEVRFWFATGGAGFCLSRSLALRMQPWTSGGAFMNTSDMIRLPDDCTVGFIVEGLLGVALTHSPLFHSHLENLSTITDLPAQVTLSYGPEDNTVDIRGAFSTQQDPTRFRSVHCLLYPDTPWCPRLT